MYDQGFTVRASTPLPSKAQFFSTNVMRVVGRFALIGGIVYMIYSSFAHPATEPLGGLVFIIGVGLEIYGWLRARREDKRFETSEQEITVKNLLSNPKLHRSCLESRRGQGARPRHPRKPGGAQAGHFEQRRHRSQADLRTMSVEDWLQWPTKSTDPAANAAIAVFLVMAAVVLIVVGGMFLLPVVAVLGIAKGVHWYAQSADADRSALRA